jgi:hypothetical protein
MVFGWSKGNKPPLPSINTKIRLRHRLCSTVHITFIRLKT